MKRRFIAQVGQMDLTVLGPGEGHEFWMGFEIESEEPVDVIAFSREIGFDLTPADGMSEEELQSVGVYDFTPLSMDGSDDEE